jgi:hypothetical protein
MLHLTEMSHRKNLRTTFISLSPIWKFLASFWVTSTLLLTERLPDQSRQHESQCCPPPNAHLWQKYTLTTPYHLVHVAVLGYD